MDFVDHRKISRSGGICCQCGKSISTSSKEYRLCDGCLEKRRASEEALRQKVRRSFNLVRSPGIRSCFLKLLLSQRVELEPSGWRKSMALSYELKDAGFSARESVQILIQAGARQNRRSNSWKRFTAMRSRILCIATRSKDWT